MKEKVDSLLSNIALCFERLLKVVRVVFCSETNALREEIEVVRVRVLKNFLVVT